VASSSVAFVAALLIAGFVFGLFRRQAARGARSTAAAGRGRVTGPT
jgi:archaellum component FlaG (FlaF/FlaG flagellin family)